jgi:hypothetical protein
MKSTASRFVLLSLFWRRVPATFELMDLELEPSEEEDAAPKS